MFLYRNSDFFEATTRARHYVDQFVDKAVEHARDRKHDTKTSEQQYVFLYELAKKTLDKTELRDQILNVLLAGRDTTASLLSITWFFLAKKPDIWDRLRKEVLTLDGRRPSFEELKSLTYLTWVLNESMYLSLQGLPFRSEN
jgi:cytochrome P450